VRCIICLSNGKMEILAIAVFMIDDDEYITKSGDKGSGGRGADNVSN
jgi:hypothetical protein